MINFTRSVTAITGMSQRRSVCEHPPVSRTQWRRHSGMSSGADLLFVTDRVHYGCQLRHAYKQYALTTHTHNALKPWPTTLLVHPN